MLNIQSILEDFRRHLAAANSPEAVEEIRIAFLGRNGQLTQMRKSVRFDQLSEQERKQFGIDFNGVKTAIESELGRSKAAFEGNDQTFDAIDFDPTLPPRDLRIGAIHPIISTQIQIEDIFRGMGFQVFAGDEAVSEFENFDALNVPGDHPARDMQDTFWLKNGMVLRTHTSSMQNRAMRQLGVPLRAIFPGRCYRNEATDATHENTFYQLEGMMIDRGISVANLIAVMKELLDKVFEADIKVRLRPGYFPFVEPGFELDFWTTIGKTERWLELMPCGMIHREVLIRGGVDPDIYSGFAFGLGLTRLAMLKYSIPDARLFNKSDLRVNTQFTAGL
jgi:phenylalanyl-tRNA synthetase alpha chain